MAIIRRNLFRSCFQIVCILGAALMVVFWLYKFEVEDRDIGIVDYVTIEEVEQFEPPLVSVCFMPPFLNKGFTRTGLTVNIPRYSQYLMGDIFDKNFQKIDYDNVTLNLENYFLYATIKFAKEKQLQTLRLNHSVIFNGYLRILRGDDFMKCFEVAIHPDSKQPYEQIVLHYNKLKLIQDLSGSLEAHMWTFWNVHSSNQFLMEVNDPKLLELFKTSSELFLTIKGIELLRRRNSRKKKCMQDWRNYDLAVLKEHVKSHRCRTPYQKLYLEFPKCNTKNSIKQAAYIFDQVRTKYFPKPCQRISKLDQSFNAGLFESKLLKVIISYPEDVKIITQSKEIDVHALIGNIGGYIGLFLGNYCSNTF